MANTNISNDTILLSKTSDEIEEILSGYSGLTASVANEISNREAADEELSLRIANINGVEYIQVDTLPDEPVTGHSDAFYLIASESSDDNNLFTEYYWRNGQWEVFGSAALDLSSYIKKADFETSLDTKADKQTANGGFIGGSKAYSYRGGAVGSEANTNDGGAIGSKAYSYRGGAVGSNATAGNGGAIGKNANASSGFAGGENAQTVSGNIAVDAVQLGTGTNSDEFTARIYDYQLLADDAVDKSVSDGCKYLKDVGKLSKLNTTDKSDIVSAINELKNNTSSSEASSTFSKYTIGNTYTGKDGLCKFSIKGKSANVTADSPTDGYVKTYYYMASQMKGKTPELPHTQAIIKVNDEERIDIGDLHGISGSYRHSSVTYQDYDDTRDEYNEYGCIQRVSDAFYPKAEYITEDLVTMVNKGVRFELRIPEKAFGTQVPLKNPPNKFSPTVCPMAIMISEANLLKMSTYSSYYQRISFAWHEANPEGETDIEKSGYYALIVQSGADGSTKAQLIQKLFYSKWYIRYTLETPIYKYNTGKLYIHTGDTVSIETKEGGYSPIVEYINTPDNIAAQVTGLEPITQNINDLNERVENVKVGETQVGYPDGSTDNYDAFVALIDNNINTGVNKVIEIPAGTYYISKPIVINQPHTTLKGSGQAIIKCPTGSPAFVISSNYTTIDGFTFWLSKTEDTASAETDNGSHSAIYVDAGIGIYNTKITNCDFQGAYRLSTKDIERSYGIYYAFAENSIYNPNQWGFSYFNIIENCRFYSLYCGLYLPYGSQPAKVWFSFDRGENIYNIQGFSGEPCYNTLGCGYGCICEGSTNFIRFDGQFIGEDHTTPTNPVFETVDGIKKAVSATINNVSVCAVKCSGTMNYIEGFAYDVQRSDKGYLWFTQQSKNNMYSILNFGTLYGSPYGLAFKDTYTVYDDNNTSYELTMRRNHPYITDGSGMNASTFTPLRYQHDLFLNSNGYLAVGEDGTTTESGTPKHFGIQDNALAYLDKWGGHGDIPAVKCYRIVNGVEESENMYDKAPSESDAVVTSPSNLFSAYSDSGWGNGLTFQHTPTEENPIYIKLTFNKPMRFERLMIRFNNYIAKNMSIQPITNYTNILAESNIGILDNNQGQVDITLYHDQNGFGGWETITGILIIITEALSIGDYNPNKYVGISNIFGLASNYGGNSYLPRGGGKLYGDINMNGNNLFLGIVDKLPVADEKYLGCTVIFKDTSRYEVYTCLKIDNEYCWMSKQDKLTFDEYPTEDSDNPVKSGGLYKQFAKLKLKSIPHTTVSGNPIAITDALADEQPLEMRVHGCKNLFDENLLLEKDTVTKTEDGYLVTQYPVVFIANMSLVKNFKSIVKPNTIYTMSRNMEIETMKNSIGAIDIRTKDETTGATVDIRLVSHGVGKKSKTFSLSKYQIDNISHILVYGAASPNEVTFSNIQLEEGETATEYEPCTVIGDLIGEKYEIPISLNNEQTVTAILDTPLSAGEYIDIISKKRNGETDITVNGDITLFDGTNNITCQTEVSPSKLEVSYYRDINKVIEELKNAILSQGGNV